MLTIFSVLSELVHSARRRPLSTCQCVIPRTDKTRPGKLNCVYTETMIYMIGQTIFGSP